MRMGEVVGTEQMTFIAEKTVRIHGKTDMRCILEDSDS